MRRACIVFAASLAATLVAASVAEAKPTVKFKAFPVAIKGYPHTGNHLGAGAAVQAEYKISGTEYGGFPPPLVGVNFYLPRAPCCTPRAPIPSACPRPKFRRIFPANGSPSSSLKTIVMISRPSSSRIWSA